MIDLCYIIWTADPEMFTIPFFKPINEFSPRWYGLLFAFGFIFSQRLLVHIFKAENKPALHVEKLTFYMILAVIIGSRLGHCLFYDPVYYLSNPLEIIKIWKGGLASHGGAIGILIAVYLFCKKYKYHYLWMFDRVVIAVALTGALIRVGNFFNSEMEGTLTKSDCGIVYARTAYQILHYDDRKIEEVQITKGGEMVSSQPGYVPITATLTYKRGVKFDENEKIFVENQVYGDLKYYSTPHIDFGESSMQYKHYEKEDRHLLEIAALGKVRHAAQLYEAFYCVILMVVLYLLWYKKRQVLPRGFNFSLLLIVLWALRFVDEYFKMNQVEFEEDLILNMGQILSIPLCLSGIILMLFIYRRKSKMSDLT